MELKAIGAVKPPKYIDYSTYNLYYSSEEIVKTEEMIQKLFRNAFKLHYSEIKLKINKMTLLF